MRVIYRKIRHVRYLYIKRNVEKVWGARYTLGARYLSKNTVIKMLVSAEQSASTMWVILPNEHETVLERSGIGVDEVLCQQFTKGSEEKQEER